MIRREELNQIESLYRGAYAGGYAKLKLAQLAKRQGNDTLARKILMEFGKRVSGCGLWTFGKRTLGIDSTPSQIQIYDGSDPPFERNPSTLWRKSAAGDSIGYQRNRSARENSADFIGHPRFKGKSMGSGESGRGISNQRKGDCHHWPSSQ